MRIQLAEKSTKFPKGIMEDLFVRIGDFVFQVDFAVIDVFEGTLTLRVGKD
ncbi:hypothetical protein LINGRAHAP2_LOCUS5171 [Linum grandiflorum]